MLIKKNLRLFLSKIVLMSFFLPTSLLVSQKITPPLRVFSVNIESSNLPLVVISTDGNSIIKEKRIVAHMGIINNGNSARNYLSDNFNDYDGSIAIELRGSSSSQYPKPQFRFETQDTMGENLNVSLCDLPIENDWILYGPYNDQSLIRNVFSYNLSNSIGRYASRTVYCELILNDEYLGLYVLMEKIKRDKNRINISKLKNIDNAGDELTGGYIVKIDKLDGENVGLWHSIFGTPFQYHYPKPDEITPQQSEYIIAYLNQFEDMMIRDNYNDPETGYTNFIDVDSFVDHFILNEFCKNVDAYRLSAFLYKDKDSVNPKLFAGPIWDFNLTFGDAWIEQEENIAEYWQVDYSKTHIDDQFKVPFWWAKLSRDYEFVEKVKLRWNKLRENILSFDNLFSQIDELVNYLTESRIRNFQRWPSGEALNYDEEILRVKGWIIRRINWIDSNLNLLSSFHSDNGIIQKDFHLFQNHPNPFNSETLIKYSLPEIFERQFATTYSQLIIYNILGEEVTRIVNNELKAGLHQVIWNTNIQPSGIYFYKLIVASINNSVLFTKTKKMILLK